MKKNKRRIARNEKHGKSKAKSVPVYKVLLEIEDNWKSQEDKNEIKGNAKLCQREVLNWTLNDILRHLHGEDAGMIVFSPGGVHEAVLDGYELRFVFREMDIGRRLPALVLDCTEVKVDQAWLEFVPWKNKDKTRPDLNKKLRQILKFPYNPEEPVEKQKFNAFMQTGKMDKRDVKYI